MRSKCCLFWFLFSYGENLSPVRRSYIILTMILADMRSWRVQAKRQSPNAWLPQYWNKSTSCKLNLGTAVCRVIAIRPMTLAEDPVIPWLHLAALGLTSLGASCWRPCHPYRGRERGGFDNCPNWEKSGSTDLSIGFFEGCLILFALHVRHFSLTVCALVFSDVLFWFTWRRKAFERCDGVFRFIGVYKYAYIYFI